MPIIFLILCEETDVERYLVTYSISQGFPGGSDGKESICNAGDAGFDIWVGKIPWSRKWQPTPVFLPRESHGQRSLVGFSPWGFKQSDKTKQLSHTHTT